MTEDTFAQIVTILEESYGVEFSEQRRRVWWQLLHGMTDDEAKRATLHVCRTSVYPPKPADLLTVFRGQGHDHIEEMAALAEAHLQENICDYRINDFGPLLNAVVRDMGGVDGVLSLMDNGQWKFERPRFKALLAAYSRGVSDEAGAVLIPVSVAEGLQTFPLAKYLERGMDYPVVRAPFAAPIEKKALPA